MEPSPIPPPSPALPATSPSPSLAPPPCPLASTDIDILENIETEIQIPLFNGGFSMFLGDEVFYDVCLFLVHSKRVFKGHRVILSYHSEHLLSLFKRTNLLSPTTTNLRVKREKRRKEEEKEEKEEAPPKVPVPGSIALLTPEGSTVIQSGTGVIKKKKKKNNLRDANGRPIIQIKLPESDLENYFEPIFKYLYGQPLEITEENAFKLLAVVKEIKISTLEQSICDFVNKGVTRDNCVDIMKKVLKIRSISIEDKCIATLARHFQVLELKESLDLNWLPYECFQQLVGHNELFVTEECTIYKKIRSYVKFHDLSSNEIDHLFLNLRIPYIDFPQLTELVEDGLCNPSMLTDALLQRLALREAKAPSEETLPTRLQMRPERGRLFEPVYDLDMNGVIYYIGTKNSTTYKNPANTGMIKVHASSVEKGKEFNIFERDKNVTAYEFWTKDIPSSWILIDLRRNRSLFPTHYTLRHGANSKTDCLRSWCFQAAKGNATKEMKWITLIRHTDDRSLNGPFATHTWAITPPEKNEKYRYFRILQTGKNSGKNNFLSLSGIEIYGELFESEYSKKILPIPMRLRHNLNN